MSVLPGKAQGRRSKKLTAEFKGCNSSMNAQPSPLGQHSPAMVLLLSHRSKSSDELPEYLHHTSHGAKAHQPDPTDTQERKMRLGVQNHQSACLAEHLGDHPKTCFSKGQKSPSVPARSPLCLVHRSHDRFFTASPHQE